MEINIRFQAFIAFMKLYSNAFDYAIYTLNYFEDKYFISLFAHFKHKEKYIITARIPKLLNKKNMITTYMLKLQ